MKKVIILVLSLATTFSIYGDSTKRELVDELLVLTKADSTIDVMYEQMGAMYTGMAQQLNIQPSEAEHFEKYGAKMFELMKQEMSWDKMKEPMVNIYLKHYTEQELKDFVAFYKTDSGKSMIAKMPVIMQESMILSQSIMQDFYPKYMALTQEMQQELAAKRNAQ
jgi:hypothetical protein